MAIYEQVLKEIGLSDKEAKVYLALISLGPSTVNQISEKADLIRTTTYDVLKSLREKGLVSSIVKNKILHFESADPSKLIENLDEKKQKAEEILPELRNLHKPILRGPLIEFYEGVEGIRTVWQDILNKKQTLLAISDFQSLFNTTKFLAPRFIHQRVENKINAKLLTEKTKETLETWKVNDKKELRETRFIQELKITPVTEYIYDDCVAILGTDIQNPLGIIIRHKDFAEQQKILFNLLWNKAEKD